MRSARLALIRVALVFGLAAAGWAVTGSPSCASPRWSEHHVSRAHVLHPADVPKVRVLRPDTGIVEAGGDRVRVRDLPVLVREDR